MMRFHHDIIIFVKNIITGEDYQNLSQNGQRVGENEWKEDVRPDRLGDYRFRNELFMELLGWNYLVLTNA